MAIAHYLAMTAAELGRCEAPPEHTAWMACHFSPYGLGLSSLPRTLPAGALLVLDDITPIHGHDPQLILTQLQERAEALSLGGVLLDLQRPGYEDAASLAALLAEELPCPVGVSDVYAAETGGAVFLPPLPLTAALSDHLAPWQGREIWLETSPLGEVITLTEAGAQASPLLRSEFPQEGLREERLRCRYQITLEPDRAEFRLWRSEDDWAAVLEEAEKLGAAKTVGLYQQWGNSPLP